MFGGLLDRTCMPSCRGAIDGEGAVPLPAGYNAEALRRRGGGCFGLRILSLKSSLLYPGRGLLGEEAMTKADIVEQVYRKIGFSKKESAEIVDLVFEIIKETLERSENLKISGFGSFVVRQKRARRGRNPQTGDEIQITPRKVLTFKPSLVLKKAINAGM